jgi:hypothetical protein
VRDAADGPAIDADRQSMVDGIATGLRSDADARS